MCKHTHTALQADALPLLLARNSLFLKNTALVFSITGLDVYFQFSWTLGWLKQVKISHICTFSLLVSYGMCCDVRDGFAREFKVLCFLLCSFTTSKLWLLNVFVLFFIGRPVPVKSAPEQFFYEAAVSIPSFYFRWLREQNASVSIRLQPWIDVNLFRLTFRYSFVPRSLIVTWAGVNSKCISIKLSGKEVLCSFYSIFEWNNFRAMCASK